MADIATVWNTQAAAGDWVLAAGDVQSGDDLQTAVLISLFSDRRAEPSDKIPDGTDDRRGWWGDEGSKYPIGSRLWLLSRAKQIPQTLLDAQGYCTEALQWLIDDGVVASTSIACAWIGPGAIGIQTTFYDQAGTVIATYQWAWKGQI